jgi:hypothetical protein
MQFLSTRNKDTWDGRCQLCFADEFRDAPCESASGPSRSSRERSVELIELESTRQR